MPSVQPFTANEEASTLEHHTSQVYQQPTDDDGCCLFSVIYLIPNVIILVLNFVAIRIAGIIHGGYVAYLHISRGLREEQVDPYALLVAEPISRSLHFDKLGLS
eukprot:GEZU01027350.1.p1 GENE.GEZU01027350.1~~GEZU01027350.1.p1  ORF type:complete len:104 (+),score=22.15 GEZU01027350.1:64-375(+)